MLSVFSIFFKIKQKISFFFYAHIPSILVSLLILFLSLSLTSFNKINVALYFDILLTAWSIFFMFSSLIINRFYFFYKSKIGNLQFNKRVFVFLSKAGRYILFLNFQETLCLILKISISIILVYYICFFALLFPHSSVFSDTLPVFFMFGTLKKDLLVLIIKISISVFFLVILFFFSNDTNKAEFCLMFNILYLSSISIISSYNLINLFVSLELFSLTLLGIMLIFFKSSKDVFSGAVKYFVVNSVASILLILGCTIVYGLFGTFSLKLISVLALNTLKAAYSWTHVYSVSLSAGLLLFGLTLKLGIAPFHIWVIDVYKTVPFSVFAIMVSISKILFFWIFYTVLNIFSHTVWVSNVFFCVSLFTMALAALAGITQTNLRGFLLFASVFNSGAIFFASAVITIPGKIAFFSYLITDCFFFLILIVILNSFFLVVKDNNISNSAKHKVTHIFDLYSIDKNKNKLVLSVILLTLSGLPPFALFFLKFNVLTAVLSGFSSNFLIFVFLFVTAINGFNYIRIIKICFFMKKVSFYESTGNQSIGYKRFNSSLRFTQLFIIFLSVFYSFFFFFIGHIDFFLELSLMNSSNLWIYSDWNLDKPYLA